MKKVIMTFEKTDVEVIGILYNSVDVHVLDVECFPPESGTETEMYTTQDYKHFEGHWLFNDDAAYETWYSTYGQKRDEHLALLLEYLEVNEVTVKIYSDIANTRIPNALPLDQYVPKEKIFRTYR
jgi:hypothetical protein